MLKKTLLIVVAVAFMCVPALAGERPEFDAVGCDSDLFFATVSTDLVLANNPWNNCVDSDFTELPACINDPVEPCEPYEFWDGPGGLRDDICFPGYQSRLVPTGFSGGKKYEYKIVLQMMPDTDLDINIIDCVVKKNTKVVFGAESGQGAHQTGRFFYEGFIPAFEATLNPRIKAKAIAGPNSAGYWDWFYLTARKHPGLYKMPLDGYYTFFTSKGIWDESIVVRLPTPYKRVPYHPGMYESVLQQGDMVKIELLMPQATPVDIRYGQYSVFLKYVGIDGTEWTTSD